MNSVLAAAENDAGTTFPVAMVEGICKAVIRQARPADRAAMWEAVRANLATAAGHSPARMPWEAPEAVSRIGWQHATGALRAMIMAAAPAERNRLAKIGAQVAEQAESGLADPAGPAPRCQVCTKPLAAGSRATRRTCSPACRQKLRRIRQRER